MPTGRTSKSKQVKARARKPGAGKPAAGSEGFFRKNGLSLAYLGLFLACLGAQSWAGWLTYNKFQAEHAGPPTSYVRYLGNAHFWQAVGENWESEFLQMGFYVLFTTFLFQRGSSESKDPDKDEEVDHEPGGKGMPRDAPWPYRAGGLVRGLYRNSLTLAFFILFLLSFALHAASGFRKENAEEAAHGNPPEKVSEYMLSPELWFESMQNWQSEFLAVLSMVCLSIFLRQKGSPESKPVAARHSDTGH